MVLILSSESDVSTNDVVDWIDFFNCECKRINQNTSIGTEISIDDEGTKLLLKISEDSVSINQINGYWYRRDFLSVLWSRSTCAHNLTIVNNESRNTVEQFLDEYLFDNGVGRIGNNRLNKLRVLHIATTLNLRVPKTLLSNKLKSYKTFLSKTQTISKRIANVNLRMNDSEMVLYAEEMAVDDLKLLNKDLVPFLVQEKVRKIAEIRVFYWLGNCYSALIHSQNNQETHIDMRHTLANGKQSRWEPFDLPESLEVKIFMLMKKLNLKSGSLDFALTLEHEFVFFEVNPVGQFGYLSEVCGYNLEKMIANDLSTGRAKAFNYGE